MHACMDVRTHAYGYEVKPPRPLHVLLRARVSEVNPCLFDLTWNKLPHLYLQCSDFDHNQLQNHGTTFMHELIVI